VTRITSSTARRCAALAFAAFAAIGAHRAGADETPLDILQRLDDFPHVQQVSFSEESVIDHEIGLGAMRKVRGVWQFKESERITGFLTRYTWQIVDGFTSAEVMAELVAMAEAREGVELRFQCRGRSCGSGAQWANRVFRQRILYGREDLQRYLVYALEEEPGYRLVIYAAARTADRQYLHAELVRIAGEGG
jgi:hypothetical protein